MSYLRSAHERAAYAAVVYAGSDVYVNKLDIRDQALLDATERAMTSRRAGQGFPPEADANTYTGFKAIHRHLFQDLYTWAGEERRYTTGRGPIPFAVPDHIGPWMEKQFAKLARESFLIGKSMEEFAEAASRLGFVASDNAPMAALLKERLKRRDDSAPPPPRKKRTRKKKTQGPGPKAG